MIPSKNTFGLYIFSLVFTSRWSLSLATLKCKGFRNVFLAQNTEVAEATDVMWDEYHSSCDDCSLDIKPASAATHLNYIPLKETENYNAVKDACKAIGTSEHPTSFCHVNSEMSVSNGGTGSNLIIDDFFIRREPVCFPFQCKTSEAAIAHSKPLGCDPSLTSCEVTDIEAECSKRPEGAGEGNCAIYADLVSKDETLLDAYTELYSDVGMECFNYKKDANSEVCTTISEPVQLTITKHFRPFRTEEAYKSYENACWDADGEVCYMSMTAQISGEIIAYNFELTADYNDYPMCFPKTCSGDGMLQLTRDEIGKEITASINTAMGKGRRLNNNSPPDFLDRILQPDDERIIYCPVNGVEICNILIGDFYCKKRTGEETVQMTVAGNTTVPATSSAVGVTMELFVAGVAFAGALLI